MTWAQDRETTRGEDLAYCLMGLFDVNMPLLYGEGEEKAFTRLQREIITARSDHSILAWTPLRDQTRFSETSYILAPTPRVRFLPAAKEPLPTPSSQGNLSLQGNKVQATVFLGKVRFAGWRRAESFAAALQFQAAGVGGFLSGPALHLERLPAANGDTLYRKVDNCILWLNMDHSRNMTAVQCGRDSSESGTRDRGCMFISPYTCPMVAADHSAQISSTLMSENSTSQQSLLWTMTITIHAAFSTTRRIHSLLHCLLPCHPPAKTQRLAHITPRLHDGNNRAQHCAVFPPHANLEVALSLPDRCHHTNWRSVFCPDRRDHVGVKIRLPCHLVRSAAPCPLLVPLG